MNNPKTIEAIKEAADMIQGSFACANNQGQCEYCKKSLERTVAKLQEALNCLQEEPTSDEHPLHAGWIQGLYDAPTEARWIKWDGKPFCPHCDAPYSKESTARGKADSCCANCGANAKTLILAPPAPVKEPEVEWEVTPLGPREAAMLCQNVYQKENPNNLHVLAYWRADDKLTCMTCPHDGCDASREVQPLGRATFLLVERRKQQGAH